jgi:hypothetical protein
VFPPFPDHPDEPESRLEFVGLEGAGENGVEVGALGAQATRRFGLVVTEALGVQALSACDEVLRMPTPERVQLTALAQTLAGVLADRVEHEEARL